MKKLFLIVAAAALLAACTKTAPEAGPVQRLTVSAAPTRVHLNSQGQSVWSAGDSFSVFYKSPVNEKWTYDGQDGSAQGSIVYRGGRIETGADIVALYPYNAAAACSDGMLYTLTPATQAWRSGSFAPGSALMLAHLQGDSGALAFDWLNAFVRLDLYGYAQVSKLLFQGLNGEKVCGATWVDLSAETPAVYVRGNQAGTEITLADASGPVTVKGSNSFWFCIPAIHYKKGYSITVTYSDGRTQSVAFGPDVTAEAGSVKVLEMTVEHPLVIPIDFTASEFPLVPVDDISIPNSPVNGTWTGANGEATSKDGRISGPEGDRFLLPWGDKEYELTICASEHAWSDSGKYYQAGYYWSPGKFLRFQTLGCWIKLPAIDKMVLSAVEIAITNSSGSKSFTFVEDLSDKDNSAAVIIEANSCFKAALTGLNAGVPCYMYGTSSYNVQISKIVLYYEQVR